MTYQDDDRIGALIKERDAERAIYNNAIARHLAEIKRLTKERDQIKSEASELAADLKRAMGENERLRTALDMVCDEIEGTEEHGGGAFDEGCSVCRAIIEARKLTAMHGAEQKAGD